MDDDSFEDEYAYADRIESDPGILVGKPVVRGTRISVERVLELLADYPSREAIFTGFPELTPDDLRACLEYARALVAGKQVHPPPGTHPRP
jgi:uncharacterized protein (DUF433 family)